MKKHSYEYLSSLPTITTVGEYATKTNLKLEENGFRYYLPHWDKGKVYIEKVCYDSHVVAIYSNYSDTGK